MDAAGAALVCRRIADCCAADRQQLRLSVSVGAAIFPRDGQASQQLLQAADRALYQMKRGRLAAGAAAHPRGAPVFSLRVPSASV
jgi:GGDEF domain-containing protein